MTSTTRLVAMASAAAAVYAACFYYRLDYPAHLLGGFGACGLWWVASSRFTGSRGVRSVVAIAGVALLAIIGELTVFGPEFDVMDVANTVMGAALGAAALAGANPPLGQPAWRQPAVLVGASCALIGIGLLVRYPIQEATSQWWYGW